MTPQITLRSLALLALVLTPMACATPQPKPDLLAVSEEQMKLRVVQTRTFEISDRNQAMRAVIAVLQDLGFIIERANEAMGLVTAARFAEPNYYDVLGVTVMVRPTETGTMEIRVNAIYNNEPITDPEDYQDFFAAVQRSLFIERN